MTMSDHHQHTIDALERDFARSNGTHAYGRAIAVGIVVGLALIGIGLVLDHAIGALAAVVGFAAITLCLGVLADEVAQRLPGGKAHHLSWRRWSGF